MQRPDNAPGTDQERLTTLIYGYTEYKEHTHNRATMTAHQCPGTKAAAPPEAESTSFPSVPFFPF